MKIGDWRTGVLAIAAIGGGGCASAPEGSAEELDLGAYVEGAWTVRFTSSDGSERGEGALTFSRKPGPGSIVPYEDDQGRLVFGDSVIPTILGGYEFDLPGLTSCAPGGDAALAGWHEPDSISVGVGSLRGGHFGSLSLYGQIQGDSVVGYWTCGIYAEQDRGGFVMVRAQQPRE